MDVDPNCQCSGCKHPGVNWGVTWHQTRCVNLPPLWDSWRGLRQPNGDPHSLYSVPPAVQQDAMRRAGEGLKYQQAEYRLPALLCQRIDCGW